MYHYILERLSLPCFIFSSNKALAESLDKCIDPDDPVYNKILRSLATKAMSNALYFSTGSLSEDQFFHYGERMKIYLIGGWRGGVVPVNVYGILA